MKKRIPIPWRQRLGDLARGPLALAVWLAAAVLCTALLGRRAAREEFTGLARALQFEVSSPTPGRVQEILVDLLEEVEPGQHLAVLEATGLEARIETMAAVVAQLRAELEAVRVQLAADERGAREDKLVELRRFASDEEELRLDALALAVEIEADGVERQRLELRLARVRALTEQGLASEGELDEARLSHESVDVRVLQNELRLGETRAALALAQRRQAEFAGLEPAAPPRDPALHALREAIRVEELRLRELEVERQGLVLRAPAHGIVQSLLASPGQALVAGDAVAVLTAILSPEVVAYLPEASALTLREGERARVSLLRPPWSVAECVVVRVGRAVEALPTRLWRDAAKPEYGLPVLARGAQALELLPGERVAVGFPSDARARGAWSLP